MGKAAGGFGFQTLIQSQNDPLPQSSGINGAGTQRIFDNKGLGMPGWTLEANQLGG